MTSERNSNVKTQIECLIYSRCLNEYVDGELSTALTWRVKNHVTVCSQCSSSVNAINSISSLLGKVERLETSTAFDSALLAKIETLPARSTAGNIVIRLLRKWRLQSHASLLSVRKLRLSVGASLAAVAFFGLAFQHIVPSTIPVQATSPTFSTVPSDPSLVPTCVSLHRSADTTDPMSDTSAVLLNNRVDNLPIQPSQSQNLSDEDAAVLLGEGM